MAIYLKKQTDGTVEAYGDLASLDGASYDMVITETQWRKANYAAHLEGGAITLGASEEGLAEQVRHERDYLLRTTVDVVNAVRWASMSEEKRAAWTEYRQALLDVPQREGFPWDGTVSDWPKAPED